VIVHYQEPSLSRTVTIQNRHYPEPSLSRTVTIKNRAEIAGRRWVDHNAGERHDPAWIAATSTALRTAKSGETDQRSADH
jgi:hypothetical protein